MKITEGKLRNIIKNALLETINIDNCYFYVYTCMEDLLKIIEKKPLNPKEYTIENGNLVLKSTFGIKNDVKIKMYRNRAPEEFFKPGREKILSTYVIVHCDLYITMSDDDIIQSHEDRYFDSMLKELLNTKSPIVDKCVIYEIGDGFRSSYTEKYFKVEDYLERILSGRIGYWNYR